METPRLRTVPILLLVAAALVAPHASAAHSETRQYVTAEGLAYIGLATVTDCASITVGGACFGVLPGESHVAVQIADASGLPTAANLQVTDAKGATILSAIFCTTTETALPPGASRVHIALYDSVLGIPACGFTSGGTTGTIAATFT